MKNKILHGLSNRPGPFLTPIFSQDPDFTPAALTDDEKAFRAKTFLDRTDTDYYLKSYLSLLHGYRDVEEVCDDVITTYRISDFGPRGVVIEGGEFVSSPGNSGKFTDPPVTILPVDLRYRITCVSDSSLDVLALDTGIVRRCTYRLTGDVPNQVLYFDWQDLPFDGPIQLNQIWAPGAQINITVEPSAFPYSVLWEIIRNDPWLFNKLLSYDLVNAIESSYDVAEKIAIALAVVVVSNPSVFPPSGAAAIPPSEHITETATQALDPRTTSTIQIISNNPLADAEIGIFYSFQFQAIGGTGRYHWSIASGSIPDGMEFNDLGVLSGVPTTIEFSNFTVKAKDY